MTATFKDHPGLGAYKGVDEPRNPFRGEELDPARTGSCALPGG